MTSLLGVDPREVERAAFARLVERLLWHLGFEAVSNIDGPGDRGADLLATRHGERWVFQVKSKTAGSVDSEAVDELRQGLIEYDGSRGVVVTNRWFSGKARTRADQLKRATTLDFRLWGIEELLRLGEHEDFRGRYSTPDLRRYQTDAYEAARADLERQHAAFLVLATGLGKTVIAGALIDWFVAQRPKSQVLVLAHTRDLVDQLERALWRHLPSRVPTQQLQGSEKPERLDGVTVATIQSAVAYVREGFRPDMIFIDEAHHTGETTQYAELLGHCLESWRLGATATPWRGDEFDVSRFFGAPSFSIGIEEGMRLGYLSDVDYRLFVDNINWEYVQDLSANSYSIAELNAKLFLPQRDERIRDELLGVWLETPNPRGIVFCRTIEHAESLLRTLRGVPYWRRAACVHTGMSKRARTTALAQFRMGDIPLLLSVDILNEGVDVPDVNIVCFARVTHSRRIFIQQLGRGLRISEGKNRVVVLDFVSDLRRAKAVLDLKSQVVSADPETVVLPASHSVTFSSPEAGSFLEQWLLDAADLTTEADQVRLSFPPVP